MINLKALCGACLLAYLFGLQAAQGSDLFREQSGVDSAVERYQVTGQGVVIAIFDRGIDWQNADFINPDGRTRIKWLLDMSGQDWCASENPAPVEYSEEQINTAISRKLPLNSRDAVGHGTVTAGIAVGNGRSFGKAHLGVATQADLIIVKMTSEGAEAHDGQPGEAAFTACISQALDWLDRKIEAMSKTNGKPVPVVVLIDSGTQLWGPCDGSSAVSRQIDEIFGNRPGRIFVAPSGDEGGQPTHAGGAYSNKATIVNLSRSGSGPTQLAMWFNGQPLSVAVEFDDDHQRLTATTDVGGGYGDQALGMSVYSPGLEFFPTTSNGDDHFVNVNVSGHVGAGRIILQGSTTEPGRFDLYSDLNLITSFTDHIVPGRLTDYASTKSAIVVGASVSAKSWTDLKGNPRTWSPDDIPGRLWSGSAGGPTRDGRRGIDVVAPGETIFATYARNSAWAADETRLIQDGGGYYGFQGATSGAAPIAAGAIALMLQMKPDLTSTQVRDLLRATASSDASTGTTPNDEWGYGKINVRAALDRLCALYPAAMCGS